MVRAGSNAKRKKRLPASAGDHGYMVPGPAAAIKARTNNEFTSWDSDFTFAGLSSVSLNGEHYL
jgi:hypothetical protein